MRNRAKDMREHFTEDDIQMANTHLKICLVSSAIKSMQINMRRHPYTTIRMAKIKIVIVPNACKDAKKTESLIQC